MRSRGERQVRHLCWPAEAFYFAVLDGRGLPRVPRVPARQLAYLLEPFVPQPLEQLHAVFVRLPRERYLACAVPTQRLREVSEQALTLTPAAVPRAVTDPVRLSHLNLLTGAYAPRAAKRARRLLGWQAVLWSATLALLLCVGLRHRTSQITAARQALAERTLLRYQEALGADLHRTALPPPLQLAAELRTLEQTRAADAPIEAVRDVAVLLGAVLACWPAELNVETDSIQVTADAVHVQGLVPSSDDAQRWATALALVPDLHLAHPAVHAAGNGVRATIKLERGAAP